MRDPFERVGKVIAGAIALMIAGTMFGLNMTWVPAVLACVLPGMFVGAAVSAIAFALTKDLPPAILLGGATTIAGTVALRDSLWLAAHFG